MNATKQIEAILRDRPESRNSDKDLFIYFMAVNGVCLSEEQRAKFKSMPSLETARRIRQKIQEQGRYLATDTVAKERNWRAMQMQQNMPSAKPERVEQIILPWGEG